MTNCRCLALASSSKTAIISTAAGRITLSPNVWVLCSVQFCKKFCHDKDFFSWNATMCNYTHFLELHFIAFINQIQCLFAMPDQCLSAILICFVSYFHQEDFCHRTHTMVVTPCNHHHHHHHPRRYNPCRVLTDSITSLQPSLSTTLVLQFLDIAKVVSIFPYL